MKYLAYYEHTPEITLEIDGSSEFEAAEAFFLEVPTDEESYVVVVGPGRKKYKYKTSAFLYDPSDTQAEDSISGTAEDHTFILSTETYLQGLSVDKRYGVVSSEYCFDPEFLKDLFETVKKIGSGRSVTTQKVLHVAKDAVMAELKADAENMGANGVIGIDLDYSEFSWKGKSMMFLVASGTAIRFKRSDTSRYL
mgnify:CR=1 FL=1